MILLLCNYLPDADGEVVLHNVHSVAKGVSWGNHHGVVGSSCQYQPVSLVYECCLGWVHWACKYTQQTHENNTQKYQNLSILSIV